MTNALFFLCLTLTLVVGLSACDKHEPERVEAYERFQQGEDMPGGNASVSVSGFNSFALPSANMPVSSRMEFHSGNAFFRQPWEPAPGENTSRDGLGPLFNTNTCEKCHIRDGRGHAPEDGALNDVSMLIRLSIPATTDQHQKMLRKAGVIPEPVYGGQFQDNALPGVKREGRIRVNYAYSTVSFADGFKVELRKPVFTIEELGYGPLDENVMMSARITPSMIGIGLLEAISEKNLLSHEDPDDADGDGISGRANRVWDVQKQRVSIGRFGWKAGVPTLRQQSAGAFNGDMGLTTSVFPNESCTDHQKECQQAFQGDAPDVSDLILNKVVFYSRNLGVPIRHDAKNPEVLKGKKLFNEVGCAKCHVASFKTASMATQSETAMTVIEQEQANQLIWPYSDFLLHDMGEELADGRPEFLATGREWRTPALWGIGHSQTVNKKAGFLHDGRARTLVESVLWHGGEAAESKKKVLEMNSEQRKALFRFIKSL
ncbi:thiol oxidoreductase [Endozoicomonas sp. (ex Bugula neritina AB1)]|nr:thiol oxidoreductase [Endozoicomonas sp. (ex Bugula neritina AB1)]